MLPLFVRLGSWGVRFGVCCSMGPRVLLWDVWRGVLVVDGRFSVGVWFPDLRWPFGACVLAVLPGLV